MECRIDLGLNISRCYFDLKNARLGVVWNQYTLEIRMSTCRKKPTLLIEMNRREMYQILHGRGYQSSRNPSQLR